MTSDMEGMSKNISKQFGLLPLNTECKMFETPIMLTPSNGIAYG